MPAGNCGFFISFFSLLLPDKRIRYPLGIVNFLYERKIMKKMYMVLSAALLMSCAMHAGQINVVNKMMQELYVQIDFQQAAGGKNQTTGQAAQVCSGNGMVQALIPPKKSQIINFASCDGKGKIKFVKTNTSNLAVINTSLGLPVDFKAPPVTKLGLDNLKLFPISSNISNVNGNAAPTETYTVTHEKGNDVTVTKS